MRAIILAAGRPGFTDHPIANLDIRGQRLIDIQLSVLRQAGIDKVTVVTGFRHDEIARTDVSIHINGEWETTGSLGSLSALSSLFDGTEDVLIQYGDTLFEPWVLQNLLECDGAFAAGCFLDRSNQDIGQYREYATLEAGALSGVSKNIEGRSLRTVFTGLLIVRKHSAKVVQTMLHELPAKDGHVGQLINALVRHGAAVMPVLVENGWVELSSDSFYKQALEAGAFIDKVIQIHTDWNFRSLRYDKLDWVNNDQLLSAMIDVARESRPQKSLDLGTGSGKVLLGLQQSLGEGEFWGVDASQAMLDKIPQREGLVLKLCKAEHLEGVPSGYFDLVTARMVFHHIADMDGAMKEMLRILRPGGRLIICEGVPPTTRSVKWYTDMFRYKEDRHTLTEGDLVNVMVRNGFEKIRTDTVVMRRASLNNWLDNSGIPQQNIDVIKELHHNAPKEVVEDYEMKYEAADCYMTWRFAVVVGTAPSA